MRWDRPDFAAAGGRLSNLCPTLLARADEVIE
jgi:hypothetical protein